MHHGWGGGCCNSCFIQPSRPIVRAFSVHTVLVFHVAIVCTCACVRWVSTLHVLVDVRGGNLMYPVACACVVRV